MAAFKRLGAAYQRSFQRRPNLTLSVTNGSLGAIADILAQTLTNPQDKDERRTWLERWDARRTARFFIFGFSMGPFLNAWNKFLEFRFPLRVQGAAPNAPVSLAALGKRVGADQLIMAPIGLCAFIGGMGLMEGRNFEKLKEKFKQLFLPALIANWKVWPIAQLVNFRYMPLAFRVPFSASCGVLWTLYLSLLNSQGALEPSTEPHERVEIEPAENPGVPPHPVDEHKMTSQVAVGR